MRANARLVKDATGNVRTMRALPFKSESLDFVLSDHFILLSYDKLEKISERDIPSMLLLKDVYRVLKPGGIMEQGRDTQSKF